MVTTPTSTGSFSVTLGPYSFMGQDLGQTFEWEGTTIVNACVTLTRAATLGMPPQALFRHLLLAAYEADSSLGPPTTSASPTVTLVRAVIHDIAASQLVGHALDSLTLLYLPPPELQERVVVLLHHADTDVAVDVIVGPRAHATTPLAFCLQRRGNPGHMTPLQPACAVELPALLRWLNHASIPVRRLTAVGWRHMVGEDLSGPSQLWREHALCDVCSSPRSLLPPCPVL